MGYDRLVFARSDLQKLLLSRIPPEKILMSKKVVSMIQDEDGVAVRCQDKSVYVADILVGADGTHSAVRQSLYRRMKQDSKLPEADMRLMSKGYVCLLGKTLP